jgi:molecular chaperone GrpE
MSDKQQQENIQTPPEQSSTDTCPHCEEKQKQVDEYRTGWQRAHADYQNLVRETNEKRSEWVKLSELQILEEFIPVYDNFKKAFAHQPAETEEKKWQNWAQGIGYIMKQFADIMKEHAVEEIKTVSEPFNPHLHDAMGEEESDEAEGIIIREMEAGYTMNGKVIKPAKVIIAK